ncbi:substrate-binding domain-containing protein [Jiangella alkaliphila]|uniref:substrate-binding domain-containing protein n=1 Tax=Jiangella alkaliphila TaxID=419479 RepID=UPI0018D3810B|nr:LacI family DNA-binding transcriptional regulator [Jiangella alkaliphila]
MDEGLFIDSSWARLEGEAAVARHLDTGRSRFDGLFAMNDSSALGAMRAVLRFGLRIPDDIAVVGFDDIDEARTSVPSLTSVGPANADIARSSLDLLEVQADAAEGRPAEQRRVPFRLHVRESSAPVTVTTG